MTHDLLIVGGGIDVCAVAREAALPGRRAAAFAQAWAALA